MGEHTNPKPILDIWKTCNLPIQKFFACLLLHNRLNTKEMITRKDFYVEFEDCILCDTYPEETTVHLIFECSFSVSFRCPIGFDWNIDYDVNTMVTYAKTRYQHNLFMEILVTCC
jgi:hypothetical protein